MAEAAGMALAPTARTRSEGAPRRFPAGRSGFVAALVVLAAALAVGSGVASSGPPTRAQRVTAIESVVRCPSCEDLSVRDSQASSAVAVRHEIASLVARGQSDSAIEQTLVDQYGPSILLSPPDSGLSSLVWLVPAVAGPLAVAALVAVFWRRGRELRRLRAGARAEPGTR